MFLLQKWHVPRLGLPFQPRSQYEKGRQNLLKANRLPTCSVCEKSVWPKAGEVLRWFITQHVVGWTVPSSESCIEIPPSGPHNVMFGDMVFKKVIMLKWGMLFHWDSGLCKKRRGHQGCVHRERGHVRTRPKVAICRPRRGLRRKQLCRQLDAGIPASNCEEIDSV